MSSGKIVFIGIILVLPILGCDLRQRIAYRCSKFPEVVVVNKVLAGHTQVTNQITSVNPGFVDVKVKEVEDCPGKAGLEILYATEQDRQKIEQIIGDTFFGIPYQMQNI